MFRVLLLGTGLAACAMTLQPPGGKDRPADNKAGGGVEVSGKVFRMVAAEGEGKKAEKAAASKDHPADNIDIDFAGSDNWGFHHFLLFTPDDKRLLTIGRDAAIRIWEVATGKRAQTLWLPRELVGTYLATRADIAPDGRRLAVCCGLHFLVIDLAAGKVTAVGRGHTEYITGLAFSPDGKRIATVGHDRLLKLWDPQTGACRATFRGPGSREFYALAWSPDGKAIATSELDGPVRLWDVATGWVRAVTRGAVYGWRLLWRPDGKAIAVLHHPRSSFVVDLAGRVLARDYDHSHWTTLAARFTPDGRLALAQAGWVVDAVTGRRVGPCPGHPRVGETAALSASGTLYASWEEYGSLTVRSLANGKVRMYVPAPPREAATAVGWSADGKSLLWTASRSGSFPVPVPPVERAFDLTKLKLGVPAPGATRTTARLKDADRAITKEEHDYGFTLTRVKGRKKLTITPSSSADDFEVHTVTLLARERAALLSDWGLALHDTTTGDELFSYSPRIDFDVCGLAPTPDGRFFATGGKTIGVYSLADRNRLLALHAHGDRWVAWTADGHYAASWGGDLPVSRFIDHGPDRLAEFVPLNRLPGRNRPDVIRRLLTAGSLKKALGQAPPPPQGPKGVTAAEKRVFLKLFEKLPTEHEGFYTEEAIDKAEPYTRVLLALTEKDIEQYGMSLGIKKENICTYPFAALSAGLLERKGPREYVVKHFAEIAHPGLKLGWAAGLFNKGATSPEIIRLLRAALESKEQSRELRAMYGPDFAWFRKRLNQVAPHESPVMRAVRKSKPALGFIQEMMGEGGGQGEGAPPRPVLGILLDAKGTVVTNHSLIKPSHRTKRRWR
jgi:WD40 repeat protein